MCCSLVHPCLTHTRLTYPLPAPGLFKAQMFDEMAARLWAAMFDLLLRMSNMFRDRRAGIIFLVVNYNHIAGTFRWAGVPGQRVQCNVWSHRVIVWVFQGFQGSLFYLLTVPRRDPIEGTGR